jgi:hypothetical protein
VYNSFLCYYMVLCIKAYTIEVVVSWEEWKIEDILVAKAAKHKKKNRQYRNNMNSPVRTSAIGLL